MLGEFVNRITQESSLAGKRVRFFTTVQYYWPTYWLGRMLVKVYHKKI